MAFQKNGPWIICFLNLNHVFIKNLPLCLSLMTLQGSCFSKYRSSVSQPPPTRTITWFLITLVTHEEIQWVFLPLYYKTAMYIASKLFGCLIQQEIGWMVGWIKLNKKSATQNGRWYSKCVKGHKTVNRWDSSLISQNKKIINPWETSRPKFVLFAINITK